MNKKILNFIIIFSLFLTPSLSLAGNLTDAPIITNIVAIDSGYETDEDADLNSIVGTVINAFLAILGTIFIALIVYGGYLWMTGMGNADKIERSRGLITAAVIGLIITLASYAISFYVLDLFTEPTLQEEVR